MFGRKARSGSRSHILRLFRAQLESKAPNCPSTAIFYIFMAPPKRLAAQSSILPQFASGSLPQSASFQPATRTR